MGWIELTFIDKPTPELEKFAREVNECCGPDPLGDNQPRSRILSAIENGENWAEPQKPEAA